MPDQFEFTLPGGRVIRTGTKRPETMPLSFISVPPQKKHDLDYIAEVSKNPNKILVSSHNGWKDRVNWFDQGGRSSCNLYMLSWMICILIWRQTGKYVRLSPEHLYILINGGKDGGSMLDDGMIAGHDTGMCAYDDRWYEAYRESDVSMEDIRRAVQSAKDHCLQECYQAETKTFETLIMDMLSTLADGGVCGTAVHVDRNYMDGGKLDRGPGNHAVAVVDYRLKTSRPQSIKDFEFLSPQSWGGNFGEGGFVWLSADHFYEPGRVHAFYCVTAVSAIRDAVNTRRIVG